MDQLKRVGLHGKMRMARATRNFTTLVRPMYEYGMHLSEVTKAHTHMMDKVMGLAFPIPYKLQTGPAYNRVRSILGLQDAEAHRNFMAAGLWQRLRYIALADESTEIHCVHHQGPSVTLIQFQFIVLTLVFIDSIHYSLDAFDAPLVRNVSMYVCMRIISAGVYDLSEFGTFLFSLKH